MTHTLDRVQSPTINVPENNRALVEQAANETERAVKFVPAVDVYGRPVSGKVGLELIEAKDYSQFWIRLNQLRKAAGLPYFK